jgi:hypothetical protein
VRGKRWISGAPVVEGGRKTDATFVLPRTAPGSEEKEGKNQNSAGLVERREWTDDQDGIVREERKREVERYAEVEKAVRYLGRQAGRPGRQAGRQAGQAGRQAGRVG